MIESLLSPRTALKHPWIMLPIGIFLVLFGFAIGFILFVKEISLIMVFFTSLFLLPFFSVLLLIEEKMQVNRPSFFKSHKNYFLLYLLLFVGIFCGYLLLGTVLSDQALVEQVFSFQNSYVQKTKGISVQLIDEFVKNPPLTISQVGAILSKNISVVLIAFMLSVLYGAASLFLVVLNASVFATFAVHVVKLISNKLFYAIFLIHLLPEMMGFLLAAISGGVLSVALMREKRGTPAFAFAVRDAAKLLCLSCILIVIAAFLEVFVSARLMLMLV